MSILVTNYFLVTSSIVILLSVIILKWKKYRHHPVNIGGQVHPAFKAVLETFRDNFKRGWERDGAALCVYYKEKCVVDIWGGFADRESERAWSENTMQIVFSTSKAIGAICVAILVDRGLIDYADKICTFWPEFGKNGKENITVEMVLTHTAGLPLLDKEITYEDAVDHEKMARILEKQTPNWSPGTQVGYHAFSYGWLVDQIIRRVDPENRGIGRFFREEIAQKYELDLHIGLPLDLAWRVARITCPSIFNRLDEFWTDPDNVDYAFIFGQYLRGGLGFKVATNPSWLQSILKVTLNNPEMYVLEQPAALGIGTARDMARLAQLLIKGKIITKPTLSRLNEPLVICRDVVTGARATRGRGVTMVDVLRNGVKSRLVGHAGLGGQNLRWDNENQIAIAYLSNGLKGGLGDRARTYVRILDTLYDCLPRNNNDRQTTK